MRVSFSRSIGVHEVIKTKIKIKINIKNYQTFRKPKQSKCHSIAPPAQRIMQKNKMQALKTKHNAKCETQNVKGRVRIAKGKRQNQNANRKNAKIVKMQKLKKQLQNTER